MMEEGVAGVAQALILQKELRWLQWGTAWLQKSTLPELNAGWGTLQGWTCMSACMHTRQLAGGQRHLSSAGSRAARVAASETARAACPGCQEKQLCEGTRSVQRTGLSTLPWHWYPCFPNTPLCKTKQNEERDSEPHENSAEKGSREQAGKARGTHATGTASAPATAQVT